MATTDRLVCSTCRVSISANVGKVHSHALKEYIKSYIITYALHENWTVIMRRHAVTFQILSYHSVPSKFYLECFIISTTLFFFCRSAWAHCSSLIHMNSSRCLNGIQTKQFTMPYQTWLEMGLLLFSLIIIIIIIHFFLWHRQCLLVPPEPSLSLLQTECSWCEQSAVIGFGANKLSQAKCRQS